ncbi:uncharacterized protein LOC114317094 [Camellia sinensis]|uniref:uncharacterized protein LOC114317094 n=1 Tax=Camellia sinensis TaxID=4442 RepID=UPI001036465C|nr:uncharacterized protein LOC114317094 [Camellia sinensis]
MVVEDNPRTWHNLLLDVLWAYRTSQISSIGITLYALVYGHDAVLPVEINIKSLRVKCQDHLSTDQYYQSMHLELENMDKLMKIDIKFDGCCCLRQMTSKGSIGLLKELAAFEKPILDCWLL